MAYLLDVNVLIARSDASHEFHVPAKQWLAERAGEPILVCPLVENGFVRILGHPQYPGGPGSPAGAPEHLRLLRERPDVHFVADDVSIADGSIFRLDDDLTSRQLTDVYLLGLAVSLGARFVTLDGRTSAGQVHGAGNALVVICPGSATDL